MTLMRHLLVATLAAATLAACAPASEGAPPESMSTDADAPLESAAAAGDTVEYPYRTAVYRCDDEYRFTALVTLNPDGAVPPGADVTHLFLPDRAVTLPHVISADGARYSDDAVTYWSKGDGALLEVDGTDHTGCTLDPIWEAARDRGVTFRATGDEPGWLLEVVREDSVRFSYGYGEHTVTAPLPALTHNARGLPAYFAQGDGFELNFVIDPRPCAGTMADEGFAKTVVVTLDRGGDYQEFHGCGNPIR